VLENQHNHSQVQVQLSSSSVAVKFISMLLQDLNHFLLYDALSVTVSFQK